MSQYSHIPRSIFPILGCVLPRNGWLDFHFCFNPWRTSWMSGLGVLCSHSPWTTYITNLKSHAPPSSNSYHKSWMEITKYLDCGCMCGEVLPAFALVMVGRDHFSLFPKMSLPRQLQQGDAGEWGKGRKGNEANKAHRKGHILEIHILSVAQCLSCPYKSLLRAQSPVPSTWALLLLSALYYQKLLHTLGDFFSPPNYLWSGKCRRWLKMLYYLFRIKTIKWEQW